MRKYIQPVLRLLVIATLLVSCGQKESVETIVTKWCELNLQEHTATTDQGKESALAAKQAFEKEVDDKYFKETEFYLSVLNGMKDCETALQNETSESTDAETLLPFAHGNATTAARAYCKLVDQMVSAAKSGSDSELNRIVSAKVIFERNMDESYKDNPERRDSIFKLIEPCMNKEVQFRAQ